MGSIKATNSAIENYINKCHTDYVDIIGVANEILSRAEKMLFKVQQDFESISRQIVRAELMNSEIDSKAKSYKNHMESSFEEANEYSAQLSYLQNNPSIVTSTDSDGNETTNVVYDTVGIHVAERNRDDALQIYYSYFEMYNEAYSVHTEVQYTLDRCKTIKKAINSVGESIQNDIFEIKKYIRNIGDEAEFNIHSLQGVLNSISAYLTSKPIFMPVGAHYEDYISS